MLSAWTIYGEIFDNDEAFRLFCSITGSGEAQGGWENGRIAALVPGSRAGLAVKIARHGADEDKHGRIFTALLRKRTTALAEIAIYRDVSLAVMAHLGQILGWPQPKAAVLAAGIRAAYAYERLGGWRRMVSLHMPARRNALGGPVPAQPSHA
jgi:hypothetical protein